MALHWLREMHQLVMIYSILFCSALHTQLQLDVPSLELYCIVLVSSHGISIRSYF